MLINLRNALMTGKRLPYDAEVEYLESTGDQCINTGVAPVDDATFVICAAFTDLNTGRFGAMRLTGPGGDTLRYYFGVLNGKWIGAINSTNYNHNISQADTDIHIFKTNSLGLYIDDVMVVAAGNSKLTIPVYLANIDGSNTAISTKAKLYSCKIYDSNGVLVRSFLPVRVGTVGYLYDRVSGRLFGNAGTGDFVLGPDVVPVEYLQSSGKQYIDTGVVGYKTTKVESHCALLNASSAYPAMWGARTGSRNNDFQIYYNTPTIGGNPSSIVLRTGNSDKSVSTSNIGANTFIGTRLDIVAADGALSVNGYNFSTPAFSNFTTPHSILMFCEYTVNTPANFGSFVYWGMKMWQADSIVRSFLPVRVGTEGAMMDVLTRRIYRNAGSGAFTYGNDLKYPIPAE